MSLRPIYTFKNILIKQAKMLLVALVVIVVLTFLNGGFFFEIYGFKYNNILNFILFGFIVGVGVALFKYIKRSPVLVGDTSNPVVRHLNLFIFRSAYYLWLFILPMTGVMIWQNFDKSEGWVFLIYIIFVLIVTTLVMVFLSILQAFLNLSLVKYDETSTFKSVSILRFVVLCGVFLIFMFPPIVLIMLIFDYILSFVESLFLIKSGSQNEQEFLELRRTFTLIFLAPILAILVCFLLLFLLVKIF